MPVIGHSHNPIQTFIVSQGVCDNESKLSRMPSQPEEISSPRCCEDACEKIDKEFELPKLDAKGVEYVLNELYA